MTQASNNQASVDKNAQAVSSDLDRMGQRLAEFENVPPDVMVSPLTTETKTIASFTPSFVIFYAPGVLALILQHVAISIASLALVREKVFGAIEFFRVAPITTMEIMLGKYGSYLLFVGFIGAILTASMVFLLGVPLLSSVWWLVLSIFLLIFASLGYGFAILATSGTESQGSPGLDAGAVGVYVFQRVRVPAHADFDSGTVHRLSAASYVQHHQPAERDAKGHPAFMALLVALGAMGVVLFVFSWWRYRRSMVRA